MDFWSTPRDDDDLGWVPDDLGDGERFISERDVRSSGEMLYEKDVWTSGEAHEAGLDALEDVNERAGRSARSRSCGPTLWRTSS